MIREVTTTVTYGKPTAATREIREGIILKYATQNYAY